MIDKQQIVDLLVESEFEFWSYEQQPPTRRDLLVSITRYNAIAEKILDYLQSEVELARQQGYDSAFVTWKRDSAEFYK
jgi:hypothetical protein